MPSLAGEKDQIIKQRFAQSNAGIVMLSLSEQDLSAALPSAAPQRSMSDAESSSVAQLRLLMSRLDDLRRQRDALESKILEVKAADDITPKLLSAVEAGVDQASVFAEQLAAYAPFEAKVNDLCAISDQAVTETRFANEAFNRAQGSNTGSMERVRVITDLDTKFEDFKEMTSHLDQGHTFYQKLNEIVDKFLTKAKDFSEIRSVHKSEMENEIRSAAARRIASRPVESYGSAPVQPNQQPAFAPPTTAYTPQAAPADANPYGGPVAPAAPYGGQYSQPVYSQQPASAPQVGLGYGQSAFGQQHLIPEVPPPAYQGYSNQQHQPPAPGAFGQHTYGQPPGSGSPPGVQYPGATPPPAPGYGAAAPVGGNPGSSQEGNDVATLRAMFPSFQVSKLTEVYRQQGGDVTRSLNALLGMQP